MDCSAIDLGSVWSVPSADTQTQNLKLFSLSLSLVCVCSNLPSSIPLSSGVPTTTPDPLFWPQWPLIHVSERPNEGLKGRGLVAWGGFSVGEIVFRGSVRPTGMDCEQAALGGYRIPWDCGTVRR